MANIKTHLDKIKNALFGQEVRGSIHDGIDAINKEVEGTTEKQNKLGEQFKNLVINEGNSNAEVAASRGSHDWLPDRLDNFDSQLEQNMNKIDEQFNVIDNELSDIVHVDNFPRTESEIDDTGRILRAMQTGKTRIKFGKGLYIANIECNKSNVEFIGEGVNNTIIRGKLENTPTIKTNGHFYITFNNLEVQSILNNNTTIIDCTDSRYLTFENFRYRQVDDNGLNPNYTANGILFADNKNNWTGYNRLKNVYGRECKNAIKSSSAFHSVLTIENCSFLHNGYFGLDLANLDSCYGHNNDISSNGKLMPAEGENKTLYGGCKILNSSNVSIYNSYCELNPNIYTGIYSPNNFLINGDCKNVNIVGIRKESGTNAKIISSDNFFSNNLLCEAFTDNGDGIKYNKNLVINGDFNYFADNFPTSFNKTNASNGSYYKEYADLPLGKDCGLRLETSSAGVTGAYQFLYNSSNTNEGCIKDVRKYKGVTLTLCCYIKTNGNNNFRIGFDTGDVGTSVYFNKGNCFSIKNTGEYTKYIIKYTITGEEQRIAVGFIQNGTGVTTRITGIAVNFGNSVNANDGQYITEDGGNILSQNFRIGGKRHGYGTSSPDITDLSYNVGDIVYNTAPSAGAYIGWVCTNKYSTQTLWKGFGLIQS